MAEISNITSNRTIKVLTTFSLMMITVGSVDSVRNLPAAALFGSQLIFYYIFGALFFLIPSGLISAELASAWPRQGGVYIWVKEAFGSRWGFLAIWLQWVENIIWYPTILSFVAGTLGYLISPSLTNNKLFLMTTILVAFWGTTLVNLRGMKSSARFSNICTISGLLIPMIMIIILGIVWLILGKPLQIHFTAANLLPNWQNTDMWVALTGIMLSFCGIEIATVHANDVKEPQKKFPRALLYSVVIILFTLIGGALAIAMVIPASQISLVASIMDACHIFLSAYHLNWLLPILGLSLIVGGLGSVSNWIIAPTKGLLIAAQDGHLPQILSVQNNREAPLYLLIVQAIVVSLLALAFNLMPSVNGYYWLLTVIGAQLYMVMYILMFAAAIKLRQKHPEVKGHFRIPGGMMGLKIVAGLGVAGCIVTFIIGFFPPSMINVGGTKHYETLLLSGLAIMGLPPFLSYFARFKRFLPRSLVLKTWL